MSLDPALVHPTVLAKAEQRVTYLPAAILSPAERVYADTLIALDRSLRSPAEMAEAAEALNPMLEVRTRFEAAGDRTWVARLDVIAAEALKAARGAENARSGMGVDLCLDLLRTAIDRAKEETVQALAILD